MGNTDSTTADTGEGASPDPEPQQLSEAFFGFAEQQGVQFTDQEKAHLTECLGTSLQSLTDEEDAKLKQVLTAVAIQLRQKAIADLLKGFITGGDDSDSDSSSSPAPKGKDKKRDHSPTPPKSNKRTRM